MASKVRRLRAKFLTFKGIALTMSAFLLWSCVINHPVFPSKEAINEKVRPGSAVRVMTKDNLLHHFIVRMMTETALIGDDRSVDYEEIESIELQEVDGWKTTGAVALGIGTIILVGSLIFLAEGPDIDFR